MNYYFRVPFYCRVSTLLNYNGDGYRNICLTRAYYYSTQITINFGMTFMYVLKSLVVSHLIGKRLPNTICGWCTHKRRVIIIFLMTRPSKVGQDTRFFPESLKLFTFLRHYRNTIYIVKPLKTTKGTILKYYKKNM